MLVRIKSTPDPIPTHSHRHSIGSEEVVSCSSKLSIDDYAATRAAADLVTKLEAGIPPTAAGACLGGSRLDALENMTSWVSSRCKCKALTKEIVAPRVHGAGQRGSKAASGLVCQARGGKDGRDDDIVMP
jgi:hypothetical protein